MGTAEKLIERRLDRMRLGQAVCEIVDILSDPELRVALVPLTEAEYSQGLESTMKVNAPENIQGVQFRDRVLTEETLVRALREADDLSVRIFNSVDELRTALDVADINYLIDMYFEMIERSSPSMEGLTEEQISDLKKVLSEMDWNELSGKQWYALKRFLSTLGPQQLTAKLHGFGSTSQSTGTSGLLEPTPENVENA